MAHCRLVVGGILAASLLAAGCGGGSSGSPSSPSPNPEAGSPGTSTAGSGTGGSTSTASTVTFRGTLGDGTGRSGTLEITIPGGATTTSRRLLATVDASGIIVFTDGTSVTLTGTYDDQTGAFTLSGSGYEVSGTITVTDKADADAIIRGSFVSPGGSGEFAAQNTEAGTVTTYCGTYEGTEDDGASASGVWNLQVSPSGTASGVGISTDDAPGDAVQLTGTVSGASLTFQIDREGADGPGSAAGTIDGGSVSGSWSTPEGSGTFSGSVCQ